jgi:hypothetical protein
LRIRDGVPLVDSTANGEVVKDYLIEFDSVDDAGSAISQSYLTTVRTSKNQSDVDAAKVWLVSYNEDDNAAIAKIRDGMRAWT